MSKNITRKSLAFGAMVALVASAFVAVPAQADANGPITLLPSSGTTFNSIIGAGITLNSVLDPSLRGSSTDAADLQGDHARYIISNPGAAHITVKLGSTAVSNPGWAIFDADGAAVTGATATTTTAGFGTTAAFGTKGTTAVYVTYTSATGTYTTNATSFAVGAGLNGSDADTNDGGVDFSAVADSITSIKVDSEGTDNVALTVRNWIDSDETAGTGIGLLNSFEQRSSVEAVTLYPATTLSAVTILDNVNVGSGAGRVTVTYPNSINANQVAANTYHAVFQGSTSLNIVGGSPVAPGGAGAANVNVVQFIAEDSLGVSGLRKATTMASLTAGYYTAQTYFKVGSTYVAVGAASPVVDLSAGANSVVDGIFVDAVATNDLRIAATESAFEARAGVKSAKIRVQVRDESANLLASNVQVRAIATATKLATGSTTTISGASGSLAKTADVVVANGRTNAAGVVEFTFTNEGAKATDQLTVSYSVKNSTGVWTDATPATLTWVTPVYSSLDVLPAAYVSGENPTVTFIAEDQFGKGMDSNTSGAFSVYASAFISGVESTTAFEGLVATTNGRATFTFKNFAPVGGSAVLQGKLLATKAASSVQVGNTTRVTVYNALAADKIAVGDTFSTDVTYRDYVTGDSSVAEVAEKIAKSGIVSGVSITGSVLNVNGAGLSGNPVVLEAPGVLFIGADGTYAQDKITAFANEFGDFSVGVAAHVVNTKGQLVKITSGGKTATTLLKTSFPEGLDGNNLKFSVKLPGFVVQNKTYRITAYLSDKWDNKLTTRGNVLQLGGVGSVDVNNLGFNNYGYMPMNFTAGEAVLFVRARKGTLGPGLLVAELNSDYEFGSEGYYAGTKDGTGELDMSSVDTDNPSTIWDETAYSSVQTKQVEALAKRPTATISKSSRGATVVVKGARATTITVERGTKSKSVSTNSNTQTVSLKKGKGVVKVYVNGKRIATL